MNFFQITQNRIIILLVIFLLYFVASATESFSTEKDQTNNPKLMNDAAAKAKLNTPVKPIHKSKVDTLESKTIQSNKKAVDKDFNYDLVNLIVSILTLLVLSRTLIWVRKYTLVAKTELARKEFPKVACLVNQDHAPLDTWITLKNLSDQSLAIRMNCNIKFGNYKIDCFDEYNGTSYWNMGPWGSKTGHIPFKNLFQQSGILSQEVIRMHEENITKEENKELSSLDDTRKARFLRSLFRSVAEDRFGPKPQLTMFIKLTCHRENQDPILNPIGNYVYDYEKRMIWIPVITDSKPIWKIS